MKELRAVDGLAYNQLQRYGRDIIAIVKRICTENRIILPSKPNEVNEDFLDEDDDDDVLLSNSAAASVVAPPTPQWIEKGTTVKQPRQRRCKFREESFIV